LFMEPISGSGGVSFVVKDLGGESQVLGNLNFQIEYSDGGIVNGTFSDVIDGRGPPGLFYHDRQDSNALNVGDYLRDTNQTAEAIFVYREGKFVGGTVYCV
ncbi:MAG TPA: hypothetical protein VGB18_00405, partial [Candidatus Thermoplasmatota archaeon]